MSLKLGLALGSGSARGWSHVGVIEGLVEHGLEPEIVAGASIGSLVGAAYAAGQLQELKSWVLALNRIDVLRLLDARLSGGGLMTGSRVMEAISELLSDQPIESLPISFAAVATDLESGKEIWLRAGSLLGAVRASSGFPGLFAPVRQDSRWLIDGGVVNPVPVSVCHALGADVVIAVNLNSDLVTRQRTNNLKPPPRLATAKSDSQLERLADRIGGWFRSLGREDNEPGLLDVVSASINIMQDRITRSRMVGEPPELMINPQLAHLELMDFHRAAEAIEAGRAAVERASIGLETLKKRLGR